MKDLWVEKHRPNTLEGYVFVDENQKAQVDGWIKDKIIPHLLFSGAAGTGKTTLAKILINMLGIHAYDIKEINASHTNSVDDIRNIVDGFATTVPFGKFKVILLDEADYLSLNAQAVLRGAMETYHETTRFILTCNFPHKIIPALHSRTQGFHIDRIDHTEFTARIAEVLLKENVNFDINVLDTYVKATYPDLRKCLNSVQANSIAGKLVEASSNTEGSDYKITAVQLFKAGKIKQARQTICANITPTDVDGIIRWTYDNLDLWAKSEEGQDKAILIIRDAAANVPLIADPEINLSAMLVELTSIKETT